MTRAATEQEIRRVEAERQVILDGFAKAIDAAECIDPDYPARAYIADVVNDAYYNPLRRLNEALEETDK
jgi:hypothetical protein